MEMDADSDAEDDPVADLRHIVSGYALGESDRREINETLGKVSAKVQRMAARVRLLEGTIREQEKIVGKQRNQLTEYRNHASELTKALSTPESRKAVLYDPLIKALAGGIVSKANELEGEPHSLDFKKLSVYEHGTYLDHLSTSPMTMEIDQPQRDGSVDPSMESLIYLLSEVMDAAQIQFSPNAESARALIDFKNHAKLPNDDPSATEEPAVKITLQAAEGFDRYELQKERALATISAWILKTVDSRYNWSFGYLVALETRKLASSTRLSLILSKVIPAPTGTGLTRALEKRVKEGEKNRKPLTKQTIVLGVFDNMSMPYGYTRKTSAAGLSQAKKNPVVTAFSIHHYTRNNSADTAAGTSFSFNPQMNHLNVPTVEQEKEQMPVDSWLPTEREKQLLVDHCKESLKLTLEKITADGEDFELVDRRGREEIGAAPQGKEIKCVFCGMKWSVRKKKCWVVEAGGSAVGCGQRIRGESSLVTGESEFELKETRTWKARQVVFGGDVSSSSTSSSGKVTRSILAPSDQDTSTIAAPLLYDRTEDMQEVLFLNPASIVANKKIVEAIGKRMQLRGFVDDDLVQSEVAFLCMDGGADRLSKDWPSLFGPHRNFIPVIASGHEMMNMTKTMMKLAYHFGGDNLAKIHTWVSLKAQMTLLGCADTHKAYSFLMSVCYPSMQASIVKEWMTALKLKGDAVYARDKGSVDILWQWLFDEEAMSDVHFSNMVFFWVVSLGAFGLLRKGLRVFDKAPVHSHEYYRAAQKHLTPFFFALGNKTWGPLVLRDWKIIDHCITPELREAYLEMFREDKEGFDFLEEQTVRETGRHMALSQTKLSVQVACLSRANGPGLSTQLSNVLGIVDRGRRDRSKVSYALDVEGCSSYADENRSFQKVPSRDTMYTLNRRTCVTSNHTALHLHTFGQVEMGKFVGQGGCEGEKVKFPENQLPKKKVNVYVDSSDDSNGGE